MFASLLVLVVLIVWVISVSVAGLIFIGAPIGDAGFENSRRKGGGHFPVVVFVVISVRSGLPREGYSCSVSRDEYVMLGDEILLHISFGPASSVSRVRLL
jgi:hypothetical protein